MDLKQLQYFTAVVDEGSISAAADKLHMSQPPLSTQMKLLEQELGVTLFERGARHILLTDAGRLLYGRAQSLLHMASATKRELSNLHSGLRGILRLGLISSSGTEMARQTFLKFHTRYPDVHFEILEGNTFELLESLKNREIEIALIRAPFPGEADLEVCDLYGDPMSAVGDEKFFVEQVLADKPGVNKLETVDLKGKPLLLYRRWEKEITDSFRREGISPDVVMMADDARTSLMWALSGLGIALVPFSFASHFAVPVLPDGTKIKIYPLKDQSLFSRLTVVKQREGRSSRIVEQFFEVFRSESSHEKASGPSSL